MCEQCSFSPSLPRAINESLLSRLVIKSEWCYRECLTCTTSSGEGAKTRAYGEGEGWPSLAAWWILCSTGRRKPGEVGSNNIICTTGIIGIYIIDWQVQHVGLLSYLLTFTLHRIISSSPHIHTWGEGHPHIMIHEKCEVVAYSWKLAHAKIQYQL